MASFVGPNVAERSRTELICVGASAVSCKTGMGLSVGQRFTIVKVSRLGAEVTPAASVAVRISL